jgi:hypothetical protein
MPAHLLVRSISPFPLPALLLHCNGRLRNLRIFYIFYEMRQTLSISVFVNFDLSFQPSDNLYTTLVRLCLLQIITKTYLSKKVNTWGGIAGKSPSYGRCGVATGKGRVCFHCPCSGDGTAPNLPVGRSPLLAFSGKAELLRRVK